MHATDESGNTTTTSVSYTLDYSSATNPPVLGVTWPQDGTYICDTQFTFQGQVNDDTATVTAQMVDASGNTNVIPAIVERGGKTWVNNLPLAAGINTLTLTATDAANNRSSTILTLTRGDVLVTLQPLCADQLNQSSVNVTGTISDFSHSVTVNGVIATNNGDGTWQAGGVPVSPTSAAIFDVETGGSTAGSQNCVQVQPPMVVLAGYYGQESANGYDPCSGAWSGSTTVNWTYDQGGSAVTLSGTNWLLTSPGCTTNPPDADPGTYYPSWTNNGDNTNAFWWNPPL